MEDIPSSIVGNISVPRLFQVGLQAPYTVVAGSCGLVHVCFAVSAHPHICGSPLSVSRIGMENHRYSQPACRATGQTESLGV